MIEHIGKDMVVNGDVLSMADYYDGIDETEDGAKIDKIISGIDRRDRDASGDVRALAQGVLFLLDKDPSPASIRDSVEQHPSAQNVSPEKVSTIADEIIQAFTAKAEELRAYKQTVDLTAAKREVFIAVIRNLEQLDEADLERIAVTLGHDKDYFKPKDQPGEARGVRERDWRERQFRD